MSKIFTIVEGLENLGAMRTGGQGSVYKGRRQASIYTAVKLLPTPIYAESADDKNYRSFQNEVEKLRKVNEQASPYVVKILSSGLTESGSLPFIEMEYIEGPDLCELLQEPHPKLFPIREVIKVADQLAAALAHCHRVGVQHGDVKSNNVRYNTRSGNYVLLDFGLALMNQEQRRTSMRQAGAIEFMAPEQNEGLMLPQTDVYSYGVVLYELLTGRVPFPLESHSETARNAVMLQHMEAAIPDIDLLRQSNLPEEWPAEIKARESIIPAWLVDVISKCLSKDPKDRYADGIQLQEAVGQGSLITPVTVLTAGPVISERDVIEPSNAATAMTPALQNENERLQTLVNQLQQDKQEQEKKLNTVQTLLLRAGGTYNAAKGAFELKDSILHISRYKIGLGVIAVMLAFAGFARYVDYRARHRNLLPPVTYKINYLPALRMALPGIRPFPTDTFTYPKRGNRASSRYKWQQPAVQKPKKKRHRLFGIFF